MSKKRRTYSREFKLEAIELLKKTGESAAQIERELGTRSAPASSVVTVEAHVRS